MFFNSLLAKLKCKLYPCMDVQDNHSVSLLLKDRPEIAELLNGHDALKRWLVEQFSGKVTRFPILWDTKEPEDSSIAEHCHPRRNEPAKIRVSRNMSGRDQLSGVIFELFNIQNHKGHSRLWKKACNGKIGKQEYSFRSYRLEYIAWKKCRRFLKKHSSVFSTADDSNRVYSEIMFLNSFRDFFATLKGRYSGETYFEKIYEERIVSFRNKTRDQTSYSENTEIEDVGHN